MAADFKYSGFFFLSLLFLTLSDIVYTTLKLFGNTESPQLIQISNWVSLITTPFYYLLIFMVSLYIALRICEMTPNILTSFVQTTGKNSFGIFLIHGFVLSVVLTVLFPKTGLTMYNWLFYPVAFTLDLILTLMAVYAIQKVPWHEYIIGSSR